MRLRFWGTRGSIPTPGPYTVKYGGNTLCLELRFPEANDRLIIIDAGSGIRELGHSLMFHGGSRRSLKMDIFLTHTHWDHIIGLPFFAPIYFQGNTATIYGPVTFEPENLEQIVGGLLTYRYFPVRQTELAAQITYRQLKEGEYDLGDGIRLQTQYLNHPLLCLAYRFEYKGKSICTGYDHEPFRNLFCTSPEDPSYNEIMALEGEEAAAAATRRLDAFFQGSDLLIHDAQYTQKEYEKSRIGWGHTPMEYAIETGIRSGVKRLALFHHEPMRRDSELERLSEKLCHERYPEGMEVFFAREGFEIGL